MRTQIIISGFGGQGVLSIGKLLAEAAMEEKREVSFLPSYGAEMRGGTSNVTVIIADEVIRCPVAIPGKVDLLAALNRPALEKFQPYLKPGGTLIVNSDLAGQAEYRGDLRVFPVAANSLAEDLGNARAVNMVISGAIQNAGGMLQKDSLLRALQKMFGAGKQHLLESNRAALLAGMDSAA